jgi:type IV secretory pathway VirB10-like protein
MRISTFTILLTAALAGLGVAHPGEEPFHQVRRSTPDHIPRPFPPSPGPPPDRPLPPLPRPLPDSLARPRNHKRQPDHEFEIHARQLEADLKALYAREAMENFDLYERDLADDFGLYERDIGTEDFELYERDLGGEDLELYERDLGEDYIDLE